MIETHNSLSNPHESNSSKSSRVRLCIRLLSAVMMVIGQIALGLLQLGTFSRPCREHEPIGKHLTRLADPMCPVDGASTAGFTGSRR